MSNDFIDPRHAKIGKYAKVLREISDAGVCPFCPEHFRWHTKPILHKDGRWLITESMQPYPNTRGHFLLICLEHLVDLDLITGVDFACVVSLVMWARQEFQLLGGGLTLRFGDTRFTGATVKHLHFHFIVPEEGTSVSFPIG